MNPMMSLLNWGARSLVFLLLINLALGAFFVLVLEDKTFNPTFMPKQAYGSCQTFWQDGKKVYVCEDHLFTLPVGAEDTIFSQQEYTRTYR